MDRKVILQPNTHEKVYIPNEIFDDFNKNEHISAKNVAFLYTYYCLITYLYRYRKYLNGTFINNDVIKEIMGYSKDYKKVDSLIKKGGVLDLSGYTESTRNIPVDVKRVEDWIEFILYSDLDKEMKQHCQLPKNYYVKKPVKGFIRWEGELGTFYDISNTHLFDINLYIEMMDQGIDTTGFYIYQYIKHKNDMYKEGYNIGSKQFEKEIKVSARSIHDKIKILEEKDYLGIKREDNKGEHTKANTYKIKTQN